MAGFGKWIGGGLGWVFGGPIGAFLGFAIGAVFDNVEVHTGQKMPTTTGDFMISLLVLMAAVMKADGKIMKSELDYVKTYLRRTFGEEDTAEALKLLKDILAKPIPLADVCEQIRNHADYSTRLQLLHLLYGIALADGIITPDEVETIEEICARLGINKADMDSIKSMFIEEIDWAYKVLEVEKTATNDEIKKAYRNMAIKYHPDKVSYLGEDIRKTATEKFQKVNEAYEKVKKEKGIV